MKRFLLALPVLLALASIALGQRITPPPVGPCTQGTLQKFDVAQVATNTGSTLTAITSCVIGGFVNNITNAAVTIRIQDGAGTPVIWVGGNADFSIPANSNLGLSLLSGVTFNSGIKAIANSPNSLNMHIDVLQNLQQ